MNGCAKSFWALTVTLFSLTLGLVPAEAATAFGVDSVSISGLKGESAVQGGATVRVLATWHMPDYSKPGDTFGLVLPPILAGSQMKFSLGDANGAEVGTCAENKTQVVCTLGDFVSTHPLRIQGTLYFCAKVSTSVTPGADIPFRFVADGETDTATISIKPTPTPTATPSPSPTTSQPPTPYRGTTFNKSGSLNSDGNVYWTLTLPATHDGLVADLHSVRITDTPGAGQVFASGGTVAYRESTHLNAAGTAPDYSGTSWVTVEGWDPHTGLIPLPDLTKGHYYQVKLQTTPTASAGKTLSNTAVLEGAGVSPSTATTTVDYLFGGTGQAFANQATPTATDLPVTAIPGTSASLGAFTVIATIVGSVALMGEVRRRRNDGDARRDPLADRTMRDG